MIIKILGTGCPNCQKLEANTKEAVRELKLEATVEKVTDMEKIMAYEVMSLPALVVGEEVKIAGRIPEVKEIKKVLTENTGKESGDQKTECCSCGGKC